MKKQGVERFMLSGKIGGTIVRAAKIPLKEHQATDLENAILSIVQQINAAKEKGLKINGLAQARLPQETFEVVRKKLSAHGKKGEEIILLYDHTPIGRILE
jgi:hypothetical protein